MSNKNFNTTPVILLKNGKKYIMMNIRMAEDGSIYFSFPYSKEKRREIVESYIGNYKDNPNFNLNDLKPYENNNEDVKFSFHPGGMIVHINSNTTGKISKDYKVFNMFNSNDEYIINLAHILMPNDMSFYKEYTKTKHENYFVVDVDKIKGDTIYMEFVISTTKTKITADVFKSPDIKVMLNFDSRTNSTYSVAISESDIDTDNSFLVILNIIKKYLVYRIR